ncbi:FUSC family protein [Roseomonas gilardii]|uniref:FUSC family protein n=1 Tax=Roseomonas gilardii TaxID=257708 RepID=UPI0004882557|nr:FUSC family protein [Roseomonas gilardii]SUE44855.1 p-hydroxybenzoic acid efflux pump subunit AaeB [Roseomonas gilardii subsp. rosea]
MSAAEGSAGTARGSATGADSTAGGILAAMGRRFRPRLPTWLAGWSHVFRTLLAFTIALYAAYALELDSPSSAGMTVLIVASASRGAVLSKSFYRAGGTVVGALASITLVAWFAQAPWLFILGFALWLGLCTFAASLLRYFRSYGAVLAGYTIALIALSAVQDPGNVFHLATARIAVVSLGVLVTAVVFLVTDLGPRRGQIQAGVTRLVAAVAAVTRQAMAGVDASTVRAARSKVAGELSALDQTVEFASVEDTGFGRHADGVRLAVAELFAVLTASQRTARLLADPALARDPEVPATWQRLTGLLDRLAMLAPDTPLDALRDDIRAAQAETARAAAACRDLPVLVALERADAMLRQLARITDTLVDLRDDTPHAPALRLRVYANPVTAARNGARAALAILIAGAFWLISGWSAGGNTLTLIGPICALMATTDSAAAASVGFFKGLAVAIPTGLVVAYALLPMTNSFVLLMVCLLPFLTIALRLSQNPRTMGQATAFQIFFIATISPGNPMTYQLGTALDVAFANLIGGFCAVLAFRVLLPPDPVAEARVLQRSLVRAVRGLAKGRLPPWLVWEHLQHQKLVRLSRRLAAVAPERRGDAIRDGGSAVLIGRALIRARLIARHPEMPPAGAAIVARAVGAFGRVDTAPAGVAAEARRASAELAALEGANAAVFHAAAMLSEAAAILEERAHFFLIGADWLAEPPRKGLPPAGGGGDGDGGGAPALARGAA